MITERQTHHEDMQSTRRMDRLGWLMTRMVMAGDNKEEGRTKADDNKDEQGG